MLGQSPRPFGPACAGVQWGLGAVGNALWRGVRLKEVLSRANLRPETVEIVVNGADSPVLDGTPDFVKSIPIDKALDDNTLIAYEMNGAPLPHFNGFPIRLIVPGWTATYWMKHLDTIEALTKPFARFLDERRLSHSDAENFRSSSIFSRK